MAEVTPEDFRAALVRLGLSQADFARVLQRLARTDKPQLRSVERWASLSGQGAPLTVAALLDVMERAPGAWQRGSVS